MYSFTPCPRCYLQYRQDWHLERLHESALQVTNMEDELAAVPQATGLFLILIHLRTSIPDTYLSSLFDRPFAVTC